MKLSLNWAQLLGYNQRPEAQDIVELINSRLGAIEEVIDQSKVYSGALIVRVQETAKHPDADKLTICQIDDGGAAQDIKRGDSGLIQVVCGAPNVAEGMLAVWLPPGATVPSSYSSDQFQLDSRQLRGRSSHGMLASAEEMDLPGGGEVVIWILLRAIAL